MTFKRKVTEVTVRLEDGTSVTYNCNGMFSISKNARKAGGYRNGQEWDEYHITWINYHEKEYPRPTPPVEEPEVPTGVNADDYLDDPLFAGIEHGVPKFRQPIDMVDFGLDEVWREFGL